MASILEFRHDSVLTCSRPGSVLSPGFTKPRTTTRFSPRPLLIGELLTRNSVGQGKRKEKNDNPRIIREAIGYVPIYDPPVGHAGSC